MPDSVPAGLAITGPMGPRYDEILTPEALDFVAELQRRFNGRRKELLVRRAERQKRFDAGETPDFLAETAQYPRGETGRSLPCPPISWTAAWRSPARSTAR